MFFVCSQCNTKYNLSHLISPNFIVEYVFENIICKLEWLPFCLCLTVLKTIWYQAPVYYDNRAANHYSINVNWIEK